MRSGLSVVPHRGGLDECDGAPIRIAVPAADAIAATSMAALPTETSRSLQCNSKSARPGLLALSLPTGRVRCTNSRVLWVNQVSDQTCGVGIGRRVNG
jgi:hypothetical protein